MFSQALHVVTTCYTNQFVSFLTGITRTEETGSNEQVHYCIRHFQVYSISYNSIYWFIASSGSYNNWFN